jgi:hypothetical protein
VANFVTRLIQVHLCIIYLAGGTSKLLGSTWWSGNSLNLVVLNPEFAPMDHPLYFALMKALASHRWLWEVVMSGGILSTLLLEVGFPFLVWDRRWRWVCVCGSVCMHTGIALIMGLTTFSLMMIVMVSAFIPPEVIARLLERWRGTGQRWLGARRPPAAAPGPKGELVLSR